MPSRLALAFLLFASSSFAGPLDPLPIRLKAGTYTADDFLTVLHKQTGNVVADCRSADRTVKHQLDLVGMTFFQALDTFGRLAGCSYSPYESALVDRPTRSRLVSDHGLFRVAVRRVTSMRSEDSELRSCVVALEVQWEPKFTPLYLDLVEAQAVFAVDNAGKRSTDKVRGGGQVPIVGQSAHEIDVRFVGPDRSSLRIDVLEGKLRFYGPIATPTFTFAPLALNINMVSQEKDDVTVTLEKIVQTPKRWEFYVRTNRKAPAARELDSYQKAAQAHLRNFQFTLWKMDGRVKTILTHETGDDEILSETPTQLRMKYLVPRKDDLGKWSLDYRAGGQIVDVVVPFAFKNVPLP